MHLNDGGRGPKKPAKKAPTRKTVPVPKPRSIDKPVLKVATKKPVALPKMFRGTDRKSPGERLTPEQFKKMTPAQKKKLFRANADYYFPKT